MRVTDARSDRVLWRHPVRAGELVELRYQHSVERTPVTEVFRVEPGGLRFLEMRFVSQGAGLPTEGYVREGDHFVLRRERWVSVLPVVVSSIPGQALGIGEVTADLVTLAGDGAAVRIAIVRRGLGGLVGW